MHSAAENQHPADEYIHCDARNLRQGNGKKTCDDHQDTNPDGPSHRFFSDCNACCGAHNFSPRRLLNIRKVSSLKLKSLKFMISFLLLILAPPHLPKSPD